MPLLVQLSIVIATVAFVAIVMAMPDMADLATVLLAVTALALLVAGLRAGLRTRALSGVWRPFEDAALAAVAHGRISDLDERLLAQPLDTVVRRVGGR